MATERIHQQGSIASLRKHFPIRKMSARYTTKPPAGVPGFEMLEPTKAVVINVTEAHAPDSDTSPETVKPAETASPPDMNHRRPQPPPLTIPAKAYIAPKQDTADQPSSPQQPPVPQAHSVHPTSPQSTKRAPESQDIKVQSSSMETPAETPVMRSIFPSYNQNVPLGQQEYRPNIEAVPGLAAARAAAGMSSNNPYRQHGNGSHASLPIAESTQPDKQDPLLQKSDSQKQTGTFSTPDELLQLWSISNGQSYEKAAESYTLELSCEDLSLDHEIITFSSSAAPFYVLAASSPSSISISRTHPLQSKTAIPICASTVASPSRQDPVLLTIFPELAGLMALDQSSSIAVSHSLPRSAASDLQKSALTNAREREAALLLWDADSDQYCLMHPTLLDNTATTLSITIMPNPTTPQQIVISAPETQLPLLTLDLHALTLKVHAQAITALPSLYILDTLMAALLTLLLHLHRSCATPRSSQPTVTDEISVPYFAPPPPSLHSRSSQRNLRSKSRAQVRSQSRASQFRSNKSVRSVAASTTHSALASPSPWQNGQSMDRDIEMGDLTPEGTSLATIQKQKPPKAMFSPDDASLPAGTRAVLKFLFWVFGIIYWILGVLVQVLVAAVVAGGKLVTKL